MKRSVTNSLFSALLVLSVTGCDKHRDDPPPAPTEAPAPPPAITKGPPAGIVTDRWVAGGRCNIETINQPTGSAAVTIKSGTPVKVAGWALDPKGANLPDALNVRFLSSAGGEYYGTVTNHVFRPDVNAKNHVEPKDAKSGFELDFDSDLLPAGTYAVTLVMQFGEKAYICDNGRKIIRE